MGSISVSLPADGTTADVADYNVPITTIVTAINGNLDANNLASGAVTNAKMATDIAPYTTIGETAQSFVASGLVIPTSASLSATTALGVVYVVGHRLSISADPHTYTASKDTYVDIDGNGVLLYTAVANGAASPSLAAGSIRIAKVVTSGTAVTTVTQTGKDSLGNLIYLQQPAAQSLVKYRQGGTTGDGAWTTSGTSNTDVSAKSVFMQAGVSTSSNGGDVTVTFPIAFTQTPVVQATMILSGGTAIINLGGTPTTTTFVFSVWSTAGARVNNVAVHWLAIGQ